MLNLETSITEIEYCFVASVHTAVTPLEVTVSILPKNIVPAEYAGARAVFEAVETESPVCENDTLAAKRAAVAAAIELNYRLNCAVACSAFEGCKRYYQYTSADAPLSDDTQLPNA